MKINNDSRCGKGRERRERYKDYGTIECLSPGLVRETARKSLALDRRERERVRRTYNLRYKATIGEIETDKEK